ncbi:Retrotransposon gag domain [Arabidopsis suecica]|uniref:Retrotransposon gag domain n=1 Tax=Arabidopsis suecica TaxID=45249 RepID=A0A8T1XB09_ARASU|nr:Retrotransposon gag domain [Arabidopsis suecica]
MPRQTRSTKQKELINLSVLDLGKLERTNQKTQQLAMADRVIKADVEGVLREEDGQAYNEAGQRLDDHGIIIPENANEDQARLNAQLAARDAAGVGVERHQQGVDRQHREQHADAISVERHNRGVDRHQHQIPAAIFAAAEPRLGQHPFHGLSHEQPMDHIERFEDLVLSMKANGVSEDYLLCKLFPYSLAGEAASWLKQLKAGSLKTWRSIKIAFLNNFYDDAKSEELRNKLSTFTQGPAEAFKAAWVRFKDYQRDCAHHGFSEVQLLGTFFRGVDWRYQMALDAASNGNFNTRFPETRMESMLDQILESQTKLVVQFNGKFDAIYTDLNGKIDNLSSHLKKLDVQIRTTPCEVQVPMQPEPVYTPAVPYPGRRRSKYEIHAAKCTAIMEKILHTLPKDASETSSASLNRFSRSLCDLGSSINLMPKSVAERLGMTHYRPTRITLLFADRSKRIPEGILEDVFVKMPEPTESPEDHRPAFFCVYEIYFKGCGLIFPLPKALVRYLSALEIALPQLTPNLLRTILGIITIATEAGYVIGVPELNELLSVRSSSKKVGYFSAYPNANRNLISHLPNKDENWHHPWFLVKKRSASIGNLPDLLPSKWTTKPARRKTLSKSIVEACEVNKSFLQFTVDKKEYRRTLLVDDGSAEGARSDGAYRPTPHREGHSGRSSHRERSPRHQPASAPPPKETRREPELTALLGRRRHPDLLVLLLQSPYLLHLDQEVKRPNGVLTPGGMKLRSEMLELKLFLFLRPSRSRRWKRRETSFDVSKPEKTPSSQASIDGVLQFASDSYSMLTTHLGELNDMIEYYERLLLDREKEVMTWKDKSSSLGAIVFIQTKKEVKGRGMELIQGAIVFIQTEKVRTELESNIEEYESNLLLLDQTHEDDFSDERERDELKTVLEEKRNCLAALPSSSFNPQQFEEFFTESPPLSESGLQWAGVSDPVEPEVPIAPASILEVVITPHEVPPSVNSETVVIDDDDGSESVVPSEQPATGEPDETETTAADPDARKPVVAMST